ncbi:hypothetical protein Dimus_035362, partial [Dionaea muscipula]
GIVSRISCVKWSEAPASKKNRTKQGEQRERGRPSGWMDAWCGVTDWPNGWVKPSGGRVRRHRVVAELGE